MEKNILVPLGPQSKGLSGVQHALALAKRIPARIFLLKFLPSRAEDAQSIQQEDVLKDLIAAARQADLKISYHTAHGPFEKEVIGFVREEKIQILILGEEEGHLDRFLLRHRAAIPAQIILVKQKESEMATRGKKRQAT
jgi:Universal stress protein family